MIAGLATSYALLNGARRSTALSREAGQVSAAVAELVDRRESSQHLFGEKSAAIAQLRALGEVCSKDGWDGHHAAAVDPRAVRTAELLVRALPDHVAVPTFAAEPDGSVSVDWMPTRHRVFSLSVGCTDQLAYAWLDGTDRGHGVALFDGYSVPDRILDGIGFVATRNAPLGTA